MRWRFEVEDEGVSKDLEDRTGGEGVRIGVGMLKSHVRPLGEEGGTNWGWEEVVHELEWSGVMELVIEKV